jgi:formate dehydrogenase major subunit
VPGLGTSLGRGGATTAQQDLLNADLILIQGSSMAEAHPVAFRFVVQARERGARVVHVDPRYSRTSAQSDLWVPIRAGADLALLGGLIRHVIEEDKIFRPYVAAYTNAPNLLREDFQDTEELGGLFSGWDEELGTYDNATWQYAGGADGEVQRDETLLHPRCVYQTLRRHFARYTPELVERVAGIPPELFRRLAGLLTESSGPERTATICYAVGWTQHSKGVQIVRAAAILQLLLGNIGRPGGGILALRGHASIQGSTDIPTLYHMLPGYLGMPTPQTPSLADYVQAQPRRDGWWSNTRKYIVSLLKAWYGDHASAENDFGFGLLPRTTRNHSHFYSFVEMADGLVEGMFVLGQNPVVGAQNGRLERKALAKLKWLVVRDMVEIETASFWYDSEEIERGELRTEEIPTEVFLFPAAGHAEKEGTFTNTQRMLQWREKAVDAPGDCRSELWFIHHLAKRLKKRAEASGDPIDEPLRALRWEYTEHGERREPSAEEVLREINGYRTANGAPVGGFAELADDGSTACGCWIYSGVWPEPGRNRAAERDPKGPYGHGWGWAWPADRRILYNRASADPDGRPWSEKKRLVWWDEQAGRWTGLDTPDFPAQKAPGYRPPPGARGVDAHRGDEPFLMQPDGRAWLFAPAGIVDGPLPAHYEPVESVVGNALYKQRDNPTVDKFRRPDNELAQPGDERFPFVLTTYRLTEHHTAGGMSRFLSRLSELQPELFAEVSPELAERLAVQNGEWVTVVTPRAAIEARVLVTRRIWPLRVDGRTVHQVAMPFHWGRRGLVQGDAVNDLIPLLAEANVSIHESKALVCNLVPGRMPRGRRWLERFRALLAPRP